MSAPVQPTPEDVQAEALTRDIAAEMPSPYCPGRSIASCPSEAARALEDDIYALAKQGKDRDAIEQVLVARFGEDKMGSANQGDILVVVLLAVAVALAFIVLGTRRWLRTSAARTAAPTHATPAPLANISPDELDRLEDELDEIDGI